MPVSVTRPRYESKGDYLPAGGDKGFLLSRYLAK
jgi:hypothetical protein